MLLLPECWPDESFYSLLARIARFNGANNHVQLTGRLFGQKDLTSVIGARVDLGSFCEATRRVYGSPRDIFQGFSVLHARARLGEFDGLALSETESPASTPMLAEMAFGGRCYWRVCSECMDRDTRVYGLAYWHRTHQLPTSYWCLEHDVPLEEWTVGRAHLHDRFFLPDDFADIQRVVVDLPIGRDNVWATLSVLGSDALADFSEILPLSSIQETFVAELRKRGFLTRLGKLRISAFLAGFSQGYGSETLRAKLLGVVSATQPKQLLYGLMDNRACRPFSRILLAQWLFGTWSAFKERCQWQDVLGQGLRAKPNNAGNIDRRPSNAPGDRPTAIEKYRQACLDYKASHPNPTRLEFLKTSYRAFRWLRQNDLVWLDEELPLPPRGGRQGDLFG